LIRWLTKEVSGGLLRESLYDEGYFKQFEERPISVTFVENSLIALIGLFIPLFLFKFTANRGNAKNNEDDNGSEFQSKFHSHLEDLGNGYSHSINESSSTSMMTKCQAA